MAYSDGNSYEEILERCLSNERLAKIDKRQGSIIYDTLAPLCFELAEAYVRMDIMEDQSYLLTAIGSNLDRKVYDYGIVREQATKAERIGIFKKYLINNQNQYVYGYNRVGTNEGNYAIIDNEFEFVGSKNGSYIYGTDIYEYAGESLGDYSVSGVHVGANNGSYLLNLNNGEPIYVYVGQGNGNYDVSAIYVGDENGNFTHRSNGYALIGQGRGDYNHAYEEVGDNLGDYVRGDVMLVDLDIPVGSRFSVPDNSNLIFQFIEKRTLFNGKEAPLDAYEEYNILECESAGTGGNTYIGTILPLTPTIGLVSAELDEEIVTTARDEETDDDLRARTQEYLNNVAFGGNIADYINQVKKEEGVGAVKVFPAYIDENQVVISSKAEDGHAIVPSQATNIQSIIRLHSQYVYVGSGEGSYSFVNNAYVEVGEGNGEYNKIVSSYPITNAKILDFDGSVRVYVLDDEYNPLGSAALSNLQNKVDPTDDSGEGYGIAPIGHYVTVSTPIEDTLSVSLDVLIDGSTLLAETPKIKEAIIDYIKSVRSKYGHDSNGEPITLTIYKSDIITSIRNNCPNVKDVRNVLLNNNNVDYVSYSNTAYIQKIPKITSEDIEVGEV